jgi:N-methylhydantoinase B
MAANSRIGSLENWERQFPLRFVRWEMVPDSGGAGRRRGGLAGRLEVEVLQNALVTAAATHHIVPAGGIFGGQDGAPHAFYLTRDGVTRTVQQHFGLPSPSKFSNLPLQAGDLYRLETGGGGGYGAPWEREVEKVEEDVLEGFVSPGQAREHYGVAIDPSTGRADAADTAALRRRLSSAASWATSGPAGVGPELPPPALRQESRKSEVGD